MAEEHTLETSLEKEKFIKLLMQIATRDKTLRGQTLETLCSTVISVVSNNGQINGHGIYLALKEQLPVILRLSIQCPFDDVRERLSELLEKLQDLGVKVPQIFFSGPSNFINITQVVPVNTDTQQTWMLFADAFIQNNRLEHITHIMGYHPQYLDSFLKMQHYLLRGDGPLSFHCRHYIAIMAAARHHCSYLVQLQTAEFLLSGGDSSWLKGLNHAPQKLQDIIEINKILAHRPWLISKSHIEKLTKGSNNWSLSEVMHAIIILSHFHSLSSFIFGCGINPELDHEGGFTFESDCNNAALPNGNVSHDQSCANGQTNTTATDCQQTEREGGIRHLLSTMRRLQEESVDQPEEELVKRFQNVETNSQKLSQSDVPSPKTDVGRYITDSDFMYLDFFSNKDMSTFRAQDYSWEDQGFSLANRLYTDIGSFLDDKFRVASTLTYYTMGDNHDVDTSSFRRAVWNYIHCMYGIRHDDYDYGEVNQLLERPLKNYVKTVTCFPERTTRQDYEVCMQEFKHSEKVHVNLMLLEARFQAELLYALRAINSYMT